MTVLNRSLIILHRSWVEQLHWRLGSSWQGSVVWLFMTDFMRGLISMRDFQTNTMAHRYLGEILQIYIRVSQWPADSRHPFAFLLTAETGEQVREVVLVKLLNLAMEASKLKKNWGASTNVLKLIRSNVASRPILDLLKEHVVKDLCGDYLRKFDLLD